MVFYFSIFICIYIVSTIKYVTGVKIRILLGFANDIKRTKIEWKFRKQNLHAFELLLLFLFFDDIQERESEFYIKNEIVPKALHKSK